jgi:hypothetical protein
MNRTVFREWCFVVRYWSSYLLPAVTLCTPVSEYQNFRATCWPWCIAVQLPDHTVLQLYIHTPNIEYHEYFRSYMTFSKFGSDIQILTFYIWFWVFFALCCIILIDKSWKYAYTRTSFRPTNAASRFPSAGVTYEMQHKFDLQWAECLSDGAPVWRAKEYISGICLE